MDQEAAIEFKLKNARIYYNLKILAFLKNWILFLTCFLNSTFTSARNS